MLDNMLAQNQRTTLNAVEKIESLYERLKLDSNEKYQFLSMHQVRKKSKVGKIYGNLLGFKFAI